jgi:hypothetical protein
MCNIKTVFKILLGLGLAILAGYAAFPQFRPLIAVLSPYLLFLVCPLTMYFMMATMQMQPADQQKKIDMDTK